MVDVSNPASPFEVGSYDTPGYAYGVAVAGSYAYVADEDAGLRVVDVSNPSAPFEVGSYDTPGYAYGVAVAGSYAYVADSDAGLRVVDVSNPASPFEVGSYDTPGYAWASPLPAPTPTWRTGRRPAGGRRLQPLIAVRGRLLRHAGVRLGVAVAGSYAYVADRDAGLRVVDVSNPAAPFEVGSYDTPGYAYGVAVAGAYAYVADGEAGLEILVSCEGLLFQDGFESGDAGAWSQSVP